MAENTKKASTISQFQLNLSKSAQEVYNILIELKSKVKSLFPSHSWIAEKIGVSRRTVLRAMKRLRELGLVKWIGQIRADNTRTVNKYTILENVTAEKNLKPIINNNIYNNNYLNNNKPNKGLSYNVKKPESPQNLSDYLCKKTAHEFVSHWFGSKNVCFQVIAETPEAIKRKETAEDQGDYRYKNKIFYGKLADLWETLAKYNMNGYGIHVAVNDTDGKGRKIENVTNINGFVLDLDGSPIDNVVKFTKQHGIEPTIAVESSPGKYHVYWQTDDCKIIDWSAIQAAIGKKFDGDYNSMPVNKTLRLPGFVHQKNKPFTTRIIHTSDEILKTDKAKKLFPPEKPKAINRNFKAPGKIWNNVIYGSSKGSRNCDMFKFVCKMKAFNVTLQEAEHHAIIYANNCNPPVREKEALKMVKRVWIKY